jgi:HEAT repeat protein
MNGAYLVLVLVGGTAAWSQVAPVATADQFLQQFRAVDWDSRATMRKSDPADQAWRTRVRTEHALVHLGPDAVPALVAGVNEPNRHVRALAALCLGAIGDQTARVPLSDRLQHDPDPTVRLYAAEALGRLGDPEALEVLATATKDANGNVALSARLARDRLENGPAPGTTLRGAARSADEVDRLSTPQIGQAAPEIALLSSDGQQVRLSSFRGQPVVVLFQLADW